MKLKGEIIWNRRGCYLRWWTGTGWRVEDLGRCANLQSIASAVQARGITLTRIRPDFTVDAVTQGNRSNRLGRPLGLAAWPSAPAVREKRSASQSISAAGS